jgi:NADPH:quinone reductase-like Zn-dependent oxidoreductase
MVKADIQMKVPDNLTDAEAATLGGALITIVSSELLGT